MQEVDVRVLIFESLKDVNQEKPTDKQFEISNQTKILAEGSAMDSLDYLNFSTALEERLVQATGKEVDLSALVIDNADAFGDVDQLATFLASRIAR
jgi:hypothetical protein